MLTAPETRTTTAEMAATVAVTALNIYPIKSCAGTSLMEGTIDWRGFVHDRELMLIDNATGTFLTQREFPRMARIRPQIADGRLRVEAPGMAEFVAPIVTAGPERLVGIWRDTCPAVDQGDEAAAWFGAYLNCDCRLVRLAGDHRRQVDQTFATSPDNQVGFADGFPFLLISEESLEDLNARLDEPLLMNRFRPNIVVRGGGPFWEDSVGTFRIGEITFRCVKPCARCPITTTDQATALVGKEPLRTLATFRRGGIHVPGPIRGAAYFGQNVTHGAIGTISVGDRVIPTATQDR